MVAVRFCGSSRIYVSYLSTLKNSLPFAVITRRLSEVDGASSDVRGFILASESASFDWLYALFFFPSGFDDEVAPADMRDEND